MSTCIVCGGQTWNGRAFAAPSPALTRDSRIEALEHALADMIDLWDVPVEESEYGGSIPRRTDAARRVLAGDKAKAPPTLADVNGPDCDCDCHFDDDMDPGSCDHCTGMSEQERAILGHGSQDYWNGPPDEDAADQSAEIPVPTDLPTSYTAQMVEAVWNERKRAAGQPGALPATFGEQITDRSALGERIARGPR